MVALAADSLAVDEPVQAADSPDLVDMAARVVDSLAADSLAVDSLAVDRPARAAD